MTDPVDYQFDETLIALIRALTGEDTLGAVIRGHLYIENELEQFIRLRLPDGAYDALNLSYSAKVRLAVGLGLPEARRGALEEVGRIRNKFAHRLDTALTDEIADRLWRAFGPEGQDVMTRQMASAREKLPGDHLLRDETTLSPKDRFNLYTVGAWASVRAENNRWRREHVEPGSEPAG